MAGRRQALRLLRRPQQAQPSAGRTVSGPSSPGSGPTQARWTRSTRLPPVPTSRAWPPSRPLTPVTSIASVSRRWPPAAKAPSAGAAAIRLEAEPLLTLAEVAATFRVDPTTVMRWAKAGKLTSIKTLGGHRRYRESEVRALLAGIPQAHPE
jgi:excisionase family DNA binding protein